MNLLRLSSWAVFAAMVCGAGCSAETRKSRSLKRAESYFAAGEFEKAKIEYRNVFKLEPKNPTALKRLGEIWSLQGSPVHARKFLTWARDVAPADIANRLRLAQALVATGEVENARNVASGILKQDPAHGEALQLLAETVRVEAGVPNDVDMEATRKALEHFPDKKAAAFHIASAHIALFQKDLLAADEAVARALEVDPKSAPAHLVHASLLLKRNEAEKAGEALKQAAELSPPRSATKLRYAEFLFQQAGSISPNRSGKRRPSQRRAN